MLNAGVNMGFELFKEMMGEELFEEKMKRADEVRNFPSSFWKYV